MLEGLAAVAILLQLVVIALVVANGRRRAVLDPEALQPSFDRLQQGLAATQALVREEVARNRGESASAAREAREELARMLKGVGDTLQQQLSHFARSSEEKSERTREAVEERLRLLQEDSAKKLDAVRASSAEAAKALREEVAGTLKGLNDSLVRSLTGLTEAQERSFAGFTENLARLTESNGQRLEGLKGAVEARLESIRENNAKQLEQMRATVDEKLQTTLEKRLGESFRQVSDRLEQVHKGLGEMQMLASGVGDLKRVLTNVKTRGTWGEVQLGSMLEQVLTPEQYAVNVATKSASERVEFAVKFPGRGTDGPDVVWLPIDAKFPTEDYQRLTEAQERADAAAAELAGKQLEARVKGCAKDIAEKYLGPPKTTDIGILFLPTEGLFAEVVRRVGLVEAIQRDYHVVVAGPTTLYALLNSFQMGFRTMSIEKRSSEVWDLLSAVKVEFGKYGEVLAKVQKKLTEASETIETDVARRARAINRQLKSVETLPETQPQNVLRLELASGAEADEA